MSGLTGINLAILVSHHREYKVASPSHQELCFARAFFTRDQFVTGRFDLAQDNSIQGCAIGIHDSYKDQMVASETCATLVLIWIQDTLFYNLKVHRWHGCVGGRGGGRRVGRGRHGGVSRR